MEVKVDAMKVVDQSVMIVSSNVVVPSGVASTYVVQ